MTDLQMARGLGVFSLALGGTQLLAPRWLARKIGTSTRPALMRAFGTREIAAGLGVLAQRNPAPSLWARFGGDLLDLGALAAAFRRSARRRRVAFAIGAVLGAAALDALYAKRLA